MTQPTISLEFFPPKNETVASQLWDAFPQLEALKPKYMTCTYGAAGSTKSGTLETLKKMRALTDIPLAAHLSFLSTTKTDLSAYVDKLWEAGVHHLVALRGDLPKGTSFSDFTGEAYYDYTYTFIKALKARHPFRITVGAYPEKHPDAPSLEADIEHLRKKCEAGADAATTQFFFENQVFYDFLEKCEKAGITTPIQPGLMPIYNFENIKRFANSCQASIPDWLEKKLAPLEPGSEEALKVATDLMIRQVEDLIQNGVSHIHFYTMNRAPILLDTCNAIGLQARAAVKSA